MDIYTSYTIILYGIKDDTQASKILLFIIKHLLMPLDFCGIVYCRSFSLISEINIMDIKNHWLADFSELAFCCLIIF